MSAAAHERQWPAEGLTRVPYWVYSDREIYDEEQARIFQGPTWSFLCLEAELPGPGSYRRSSLGAMPVVVTRDRDGKLQRLREPLRASRLAAGAQRERRGARHHLRLSQLELRSLPAISPASRSARGSAARAACRRNAGPSSTGRASCGSRRSAAWSSARSSADAPALEHYLGPEIVARIRRVMRAPVKLLGGYSQTLPSNWKLYMENVKDSYHASLLHTFFTTFRLNRLSQQGGMVVSPCGGHHVSYSLCRRHRRQRIRAGRHARGAGRFWARGAARCWRRSTSSATASGCRSSRCFPSFVLQQTRNSLAVRRLVPQGLDRSELVWTCFGFTDDDDAMTERRLRQANLIGPAGYISMEDGAAPGFVQRAVATASDLLSVVEMGGASVASADNRVTEAAVRGFWKAYRRHDGDVSGPGCADRRSARSVGVAAALARPNIARARADCWVSPRLKRAGYDAQTLRIY